MIEINIDKSTEKEKRFEQQQEKYFLKYKDSILKYFCKHIKRLLKTGDFSTTTYPGERYFYIYVPGCLNRIHYRYTCCHRETIDKYLSEKIKEFLINEGIPVKGKVKVECFNNVHIYVKD